MLNIDWVADAVDRPASIICPRSAACPRPERCADLSAIPRAVEIGAIRDEIIRDASQA